MSVETPTAVFDHPRINENNDAIDTMIRDVFGHDAVAAAIAPNFSVEQPSASPTLHKAFDITPQFATVASNCAGNNKTQSHGRYDGEESLETPHIGGYAIKVSDNMALSSPARIQHTLGAWNQGLGTSIYRVSDFPSSLTRGDDASWLALNEGARDDLPHLISPSHRITLERASAETGFGDDDYVVVVTANDPAAARRLWQYVAARAGSGEPVTVGSLYDSPEYSMVHERSQCARDTLAQKYATALGLTVEPKAILSSSHYTITPADQLAHGNHESRTPNDIASEPRFFVVYSNATPAHTAEGGVVVSHGIMGGHSVLRTEDGSAWHNTKYLSAVPATSAAVHDGKTAVPSLHRDQTIETRAAFDARVTWRGDLAGTVIHSAANEAYESMHDPYSIDWADKLSARHKGPLRRRDYRFIAGQLPSDSTLYLTREDLYAVSMLPETPPNILVALDNDIVSDITRNWDSVVRQSGYKGDLRDVFENVYEREDDNDDGFRLLSSHTMCKNPAHEHSREPKDFYIDAVQYGITPKTGTYVRSLSQADIEERTTRQRTGNYGTSPFIADAQDFQSRTVVNLDKALIAVVAKPYDRSRFYDDRGQ